jgi:hypothetical protein
MYIYMNKSFNQNYYKHKYLKYKSKYLQNKNNFVGGNPTKKEIIDEIKLLLNINSKRIIQSFRINRISREPFRIPYTDNDETIIENIREAVNPVLTKNLHDFSISSRARFDLHLSITDSHIEINLEIIPLFGCLLLDDRNGRIRLINRENCIILEEKLRFSQNREQLKNLGNILREYLKNNPDVVETKMVNLEEYDYIDFLNHQDLETLKIVHSLHRK